MCAAFVAVTISTNANAKVVMLNGDIQLEKVAPGQPFHVGDHHKFRIFYDDAAVDPNTHIVKPIFLQHSVTTSWDNPFMLHGQWAPLQPDPVEMPMNDCFLDLSAQPYRFHHRQTTGSNGATTFFDESTRTFSAVNQKDGSIIISGPYTVDIRPVSGEEVDAVVQGGTTVNAPVGTTAQTGQHKIMMLNGDILVEYVAASQHANVGDHHKFRVFYDEAAVDPKSHIVKPILVQHNVTTARDNPFMLHGQWAPGHPDAVKMPMDDVFLDLSAQPYRFHYKNPNFGTSTTLFDEIARTFSVSSNTDNSIVFLGHYAIDTKAASGDSVTAVIMSVSAGAQSPTPAKSTIVMLNVDGVIEYVDPDQKGYVVGGHDKVRIVYDEAAVDPKTHIVKLLNMQHFVRDHYSPARPNPTQMPMDDAWLDLSSLPYRFHYRASVVHGQPIIIEVDEKARTLSIKSATRPGNPVLLREKYTIDPTPIRGQEAIEAGTPTPPTPAGAGASRGGAVPVIASQSDRRPN
jgi:hypothetical protein